MVLHCYSFKADQMFVHNVLYFACFMYIHHLCALRYFKMEINHQERIHCADRIVFSNLAV